ncbi:MAG: family 20 glycosylhydrolase, partial [Alistipes sp.]
SIGGFRGGDSPIKSVYGKWGEKYGGFFTQDEMRALINYAAVRNIEIIPEIDLPGHSRNIAQLHPEILCNYTPDTTPANGYDLRSAWCVAREANYALLEDILGELCTLFPSPYIHVGGDEVKVSQWKKCPDCRALMRKLAITDARLLEDHFMERISKILQKHGKLPAVWNEAARSGKLTHQSRVHGWEHMQACLDATALGYPTIIMPASHFYFDMRQAPREEGHDWAAIFDAKKTYEFDFSTAGFSPAQRQHVVGLQGAFWSETYASHTPESPNHLDFLCFPRVCALAQIAWHGNAEGWNAFYTELQRSHYDRMATMGICFRMFPPNVSYKEGRLTVTTSDRAADIFYTEEGDTTQYRYTHPITTTAPHRFLFHSHYKSGRSAEVAAAAYYRTITPAVKLSTSMGEGDVPYANVNSYKTFARTARAC